MFEAAAAHPDRIRLGSILSSEKPVDVRQTIDASSAGGNRELDRLRQRVDKVALTRSTGSAQAWFPMGRHKPALLSTSAARAANCQLTFGTFCCGRRPDQEQGLGAWRFRAAQSAPAEERPEPSAGSPARTCALPSRPGSNGLTTAGDGNYGRAKPPLSTNKQSTGPRSQRSARAPCALRSRRRRRRARYRRQRQGDAMGANFCHHRVVSEYCGPWMQRGTPCHSSHARRVKVRAHHKGWFKPS